MHTIILPEDLVLA
jgi:hypothetical protein